MQSKHHSGLVIIDTAGLPGLDVVLANFSRDEGIRGPDGEGPGQTDDAGKDGCSEGRGDEEGKRHAECKEQMGENPGAAEGEPWNLGQGKEAGQAGV